MPLTLSFFAAARARTSPVRKSGTRRMIVLLGALAASWAWSAPAFAGDGVLEINQTCAVQTGCFAGDTAGFPVTIVASGSYRLTSNLVVASQLTSAIVVSTDDVGLDLNNFSIRGPVVCSGTPLACVPAAASGSGVERTSVSLSGISVRNGSIRGMGSHGVLLGRQSEVTNVRFRSNRLDGISVSNASNVSNNTVFENGRDGIVTTEGSIVSGNTVYLNGQRGIFVSFGSTVSGNSTYRNGDDGIEARSGSTVSGNTTYLNGATGINAGSAATISGNTAYENELDGIYTDFGATVWGNTVRGNTRLGLNLGPETGYRENVISNNTAGTVNTGIVNLGNNACNGSTTCP